MFNLQIDTDSPPFKEVAPCYLIPAMLRKLAAAIEEDGARGGKIHDEDGTRVGEWSLDGARR